MKHGPRTILLKLLTILLSGSPYQWWTRQQGTAGLIPQQSQLRRLTLHARHLSMATSVKIVELVGINQFQMFATVSIKKFPRGISDQVISNSSLREHAARAPDPGLKNILVWFFQDHQWKQRHQQIKQQAPSVKHHAPVFRKRQASSGKPQASSAKRQASKPE